MASHIFEIIANMVYYILDIRWHEIPKNILYLGVIICTGYCMALILIGFPCSIWEEITKKKIRDGVEDKITRFATICFSIMLLIMLFA